MSLDDLVEPVNMADGHDSAASGDVVEVPLQQVRREVGGVAAVGGQPHASRQVIEGGEVAHGPLVGQHAGEADDAVYPDRPQCVRKGGGAHELESRVGARREDLPYLARHVAVIDEYVVRPGAGQGAALGRGAGGGQDRHAPLPGQDRRGQPDRRSPAPDHDGLPRAPSPTSSEPWAVCSISGTAPSTAQSSSLRNGTTWAAGTHVYSA